MNIHLDLYLIHLCRSCHRHSSALRVRVIQYFSSGTK
jgi:hypothetical protein